jgi:hypothetical protein
LKSNWAYNPFLGATGDAGEQISRVRPSGNTPIASTFVNDQVEVVDSVAMDDFTYAEPVPEAWLRRV